MFTSWDAPKISGMPLGKLKAIRPIEVWLLVANFFSWELKSQISGCPCFMVDLVDMIQGLPFSLT